MLVIAKGAVGVTMVGRTQTFMLILNAFEVYLKPYWLRHEIVDVAVASVSEDATPSMETLLSAVKEITGFVEVHPVHLSVLASIAVF